MKAFIQKVNTTKALIFAICFLLPHLLWTAEIIFDKELLITDLSVTTSQLTKVAGPLNFFTVFNGLNRSRLSASDFFSAWISEWTRESWNGFSVKKRAASPLQRDDFKLLAVVFRPDLVKPRAPFGEARLVYGAYNPNTQIQHEFYVILEFNLPSTSNWAQSFHHLGQLSFGDEYNAELAQLVRAFAVPRNFSQLRTNDFYLGNDSWQWREFHLSQLGPLRMASLAQSPPNDFLETGALQNSLSDWVAANAADVQNQVAVVPPQFLGAACETTSEDFEWKLASNVPLAVQNSFSLMTCNGCHAGSTGTRFTHISNRDDFHEPRLSTFLVNDLPVRAEILERMLNGERVPAYPRGRARVH